MGAGRISSWGGIRRRGIGRGRALIRDSEVVGKEEFVGSLLVDGWVCKGVGI